MSTTREEFIRAMGGQDVLDQGNLVVVSCECGHECCQGWNVERVEP